MCGICGIYSFQRVQPESRQLIQRMCDVVIHRGPDDEGYYFDEKVVLGMRRLSIIDIVTGHQPISNEEKNIWVIFNGEIYNFPLLRSQLVQSGHRFITQSDTETLVHLYEEEGEEFVKRLNGMFAIAIWDGKKQKLILVRDRLGIKPLHYFESPDQLIFASEIKSILQTDCRRDIDFEALSQYFTFEYIPAPRTVFKGIKKLLPGHMLIVQHNRISIAPYWDVRYEQSQKDSVQESHLQEEIYHRLKESVRRRLISDVPLGVFLSGGMDSSTVTTLMSEVTSSKIKTFSIGFEEKSFDELGYARSVAEFLETEHQEFVVRSDQVRELVPVLMKFLDEPLADASIIPTFLLSRLARQYVTVALAGDGGDELFAGYDTYKAYQLAKYYRRVPKFIRDHLVKNIVAHLPASPRRLSFEFRAKKFISGIDFPPEIANYIWWGAFSPAEKENLFTPHLRSLIQQDPYRPVYAQLEHYLPEDPLARLGYLDLKLYLQDDLLVKVDRMSMANSLEIRVPFLDHTFVEFAASIPSSLKLRGLRTKYILKKTMKKHLPPGITTRKKTGFDIPLGIWIKNELRDFVLEVLSPSNLKKHGFFNEVKIRKILDEHFNGHHNHRQLLWPLIIFQFWFDHYMT